ncbi:M15 family metallopeptidase [Streptomyces sp. NPDC026673]|uniref:M15 family metallopeptidase n=1 Tax=Streptomyces sp. NPDC026673 TaxID=3155724 RepID=UPI0033F49B5B
MPAGIVSLAALAVLAHLAPLAGHQRSSPGPAAERDGLDGGEIPSGRVVTPFDTRYPAVTRLSPGLLKALRKAYEDAGRSGVTLRVTSGWRSEAHQQRLLDAAVRKYGSLSEARRFVNTPEKSAHVRGDAVDIGPTDADDWLIQHGARYGLCQIYTNEMWHFELRATPGGTCPVPLTDATE